MCWINLSDKHFFMDYFSITEVMFRRHLDSKRNKVKLKCLKWPLLITVNPSQKLDVSGCPPSQIYTLLDLEFH